MKFYLLTVIFIFLALGIGIFIGFIFDAQGILMTEREDLIEKLEEKFTDLESEKEKIRESMSVIEKENNNYLEFMEVIFPQLIKDRLKDLNVAIVAIDQDYDYSEIVYTLENSGANVVSYTIFKDNFLEKLETSETSMIINETGLSIDEVYNKLIFKLTETIISGSKENIIDYLSNNNLIKTVGDYDKFVDYVIIAGGRSKSDIVKEDTIHRNIIDCVNRKNVPIVGVERSDVSVSFIDIYKKKGISTIDNINSIIGKVSLVYTMKGNPGNYGVKSSAESLTAFPKDNINEGEFR